MRKRAIFAMHTRSTSGSLRVTSYDEISQLSVTQDTSSCLRFVLRHLFEHSWNREEIRCKSCEREVRGLHNHEWLRIYCPLELVI